MANVIDILIGAKWTGGAATGAAAGDLRTLGNKATASSIEMAAVGARSRLLGTAMNQLGEQVALGTLTVDQGVDAFNQYKSQLADVSVQAPKTGINIAGLTTKIFAATAALTALIVTAKKLGKTISEGAEIEATTIRFDRLAESIGTTGEALRSDLGVATRGLVSDMGVLASATDFLALGLVQTHDEAVRLTAVAAQLGFNMNQLVLTLTNQTTMRFDALGVAVVGFEEKVKALEEAGYDANEAFKLAFLEQAEEQIERVGSRAETTAGKIDILTASYNNLIDAAKLDVAEGAGPLLELLSSGTVAANKAEAAVGSFGAAIGDLKTQKGAVDELRAALDELGSFRAASGLFYASSFERGRQAVLEFAVTAAESGDTLEDQQDILRDLGFEINNAGLSLDGFTVTWEELNAAIDALNLQGVSSEFSDIDQKLSQFINTNRDVAAALEYTGQQIPLEELEEFAAEMGVTDQQAKDLAISLEGTGNALEFLKNLSDDPSGFFSGFEETFGKVGETLEMMTESVQERADLWLDFQSDLTEIGEKEGESRTEAEERHEARRSEIADQFGASRARQEEDWNRQRARADAKLQSDIDSTREDSAERQAELREKANRRLSDLERDHLDRMTDIVENADIQLAEAAGHLDAAAVVSITRQRKKALEDEEESYRDSRDDIQRNLAEQLEAERRQAEERIADLQSFHEERKRIEDEDRAIRLERQQEDHAAQLAQLDIQQQERLDQITEQGEEERARRETQYENFWQDREKIEFDKMTEILAAEQKWWDDRANMAPTSPAGSPGSDLGSQFFQGAGGSIGDISVNINGADSPEDTAEEVRQMFLKLFGNFS